MKGLLLICILFVFIFIQGNNCTTKTSVDESSDEEYYYEEYEYENEEHPQPRRNLRNGTTTTNVPLRVTTFERIIDTTTFATESTTTTHELKCPKNCKCSEKITLVDCSHQNLTQIPKDLPPSTIYLNLSHNSLSALNVSDLMDCGELRQLYLNNNEIKKIVNTEDFAKLPSLHHIDLSTNAFKPLQGREFSKARGLLTLILTDNKNIIASNVSIIQIEKLKTLYLANCNITQLSENTFQNLSSLVALNLNDNPLNLTKGVSAFKPLTNLRKLFIPTVPRNIALDLCRNLQVIDIINLSSENHDISCYLLSASSTYEESTIRTDLFKIPTDDPLNSTGGVSTTEKPELVQKHSEMMEPSSPIASEQTETTYEKMSMMYMILTGFVVVLLVAILSVLCIIGSRQFGKEILYRKQNYQKYFAGNLTVENPNYERYLIECEKQQITHE